MRLQAGTFAKHASFMGRLGQVAGLGGMAMAAPFAMGAAGLPAAALGAGAFGLGSLANRAAPAMAQAAPQVAQAAGPGVAGMLKGLPPWAKMLGAGAGAFGLYNMMKSDPPPRGPYGRYQ